jgi:anti-anti-sigma factor
VAPHETDPAVPGPALSVRRQGRFTIVSITGGLDAGTVPVLRERVHDLLLPRESQIVIDLSETPRCDQSGLALLIGVGRRAGPLGQALRIVAPPALVADALCRTGLRSRFTFFASLPEALSPQPASRPGSGQDPATSPVGRHAVALSWRDSAPRRSHEGAPVVRRSVSEMVPTMVAPSTTRPPESWRRLLVSSAC